MTTNHSSKKRKNSSRSGGARRSSSGRSSGSGSSGRSSRSGGSSRSAGSPRSRRRSSSAGRSTRRRRSNSRRRPLIRIRPPKRKSLVLIIAVLVVIIGVLAYLLLHQTPVKRIDSQGYTHAARFSDDVVVDGIDVSAYQGGSIDWNSVKNSGVDFVIVRAGYTDAVNGSMHKDAYFQQNVDGAKDAGLMVGAYYFSQATTKAEAKKEARFMLKAVDPVKDEIDLPLVMDYETHGSGKLATALSAGKMNGKTMGITNAFFTAVEKAGFESCIYANYNFLTNTLDSTKLGNRTDVWVAQYNTQSDLESTYQMWQCSDRTRVPGISKYVDKDFLYLPVKDSLPSTVQNSKRTPIEHTRIVFTSSKSEYTHFRNPVKPELKVKNGLKTLKEGTDYQVSYIKNTSAGTGYAVIHGIGDYRNTVVKKFDIKELF